MTTTATNTEANPSDVGRYLDAVASHLASLPWLSDKDRAGLLDDLAQHLAEVSAEEASPLAERLGPPVAYAEDLLSAAGFEAPAGTAAARPLWARPREVLGTAEDLLRRKAPALGDLRPAWLILRGYLAASLLGVLTSGGHHVNGHAGFPVPAVFGNRLVGILAVVAAVRASVRWGVQQNPARRWVTRGAGAGLGVYGLVLLATVGDGGGDVQGFSTATPIGNPTCLLNGAGQVIENLYPYDTQGRLLDQVLLYDQTGRPLDNLCPDAYDDQGLPITTEYGRDENGAPVINVFPRRQTSAPPPMAEPGSGVPTPTVGPRAISPPAVVVPRLVTTTTTAAPATTSTTAESQPPTTITQAPPASEGSGE